MLRPDLPEGEGGARGIEERALVVELRHHQHRVEPARVRQLGIDGAAAALGGPGQAGVDAGGLEQGLQQQRLAGGIGAPLGEDLLQRDVRVDPDAIPFLALDLVADIAVEGFGLLPWRARAGDPGRLLGHAFVAFPHLFVDRLHDLARRVPVVQVDLQPAAGPVGAREHQDLGRQVGIGGAVGDPRDGGEVVRPGPELVAGRAGLLGLLDPDPHRRAAPDLHVPLPRPSCRRLPSGAPAFPPRRTARAPARRGGRR